MGMSFGNTFEAKNFGWLLMENLFLAGWCIFAGVFVTSVPAIIALKLKRMISSHAGLVDTGGRQSGDLPLISVIIPARNEEAQIGEALKGLLKTEGVRIEIIAVNDRSTDRTGVIMDEVAASDSRIRVIHIDQLPEHWLGKNHAMHQASLLAQGDWLLFTDGDILFQPRTIAAAVGYMQSRKLQHLCLLPKMIPGSLLENVLTIFFGMCFAIGMQLHLIHPPTILDYAEMIRLFNLEVFMLAITTVCRL